MRLLTVSLLLGLSGLLPAVASGQQAGPGGPATADPAPATEVIVRFAPGTDARERGEARSEADVRREAVLPLAGAELVDPEPGVGVAEAVRDLERDPGVLYAEPNASRVALAPPNDEFFRVQWGLQNTGQRALAPPNAAGTLAADIRAPAAWDVTTGSREVAVAVIDSGADTSHPDLVDNLWRNPGESGPGQATNGLDDDGNGFADDVNGWDFFANDAQPLDDEGHGTHVTGTVGAKGNNAIGVTGVAQSGSLMILRALDANGSGSVAGVISAYAYAARNGARVVNLSFGGGDGSRAERDAIAAASGLLFVAAAGNDGANNDVVGSFPCNYDLPNVVCVGASDRNDALAGFSNRGARTVDLVAPGVEIASTYFDPTSTSAASRYVYLSGTSMAAPHVAGIAALALSRAPGLTVSQLRDALLTSVDVLPALQPVTVTGGRANAARAVQAAGAAETGAPASTGSTGATGPAGPAPSTTVSPPPAPPPAPAPVVTLPPPVAPPVTVAVDRNAPGLVLSTPRVQRVRTLRARGLRATVSCSEACRLSAGLTLDAATARKLGLRSRRIAFKTATTTRAGRRVVVLRLTAAARTRLRRSARATLQVTARDAAGNSRTRSLRVSLRS